MEVRRTEEGRRAKWTETENNAALEGRHQRVWAGGWDSVRAGTEVQAAGGTRQRAEKRMMEDFHKGSGYDGCRA